MFSAILRLQDLKERDNGPDLAHRLWFPNPCHRIFASRYIGVLLGSSNVIWAGLDWNGVAMGNAWDHAC